MTEQWAKRVLIDFLQDPPGREQILDVAPRSAHAFLRSKHALKPDVILSTGSGGNLILLTPDHPSDHGNWGYSNVILLSSVGPIGIPAVMDINGDQIPELCVPRYSEDALDIYTLTSLDESTKCGLCVDCLNQNGRCPCCCMDTDACRRCDTPFLGNTMSCQGSCGFCEGKNALFGESCICGKEKGGYCSCSGDFLEKLTPSVVSG